MSRASSRGRRSISHAPRRDKSCVHCTVNDINLTHMRGRCVARWRNIWPAGWHSLSLGGHGSTCEVSVCFCFCFCWLFHKLLFLHESAIFERFCRKVTCDLNINPLRAEHNCLIKAQSVPRNKQPFLIITIRQCAVTYHSGVFLQQLLLWNSNKYYIFWACVCSPSYPALQCACAILSSVACQALQYFSTVWSWDYVGKRFLEEKKSDWK